MFQVMSDNWKDRLADDRTKDRKEIDDWMYGSGGKVLGAIVVIIGLWLIVRMFWN